MPRKSPSSSEPHISRIDTTSTLGRHAHGYQVCISHGGRIVTKFFDDDECNGKAGSLKAARSFRDEAMQKLGMTLPLKVSRQMPNGLRPEKTSAARRSRKRA